MKKLTFFSPGSRSEHYIVARADKEFSTGGSAHTGEIASSSSAPKEDIHYHLSSCALKYLKMVPPHRLKK